MILAHNYQTPEIFHCVADFVGDSLGLARQATTSKADIIVQCGVHFMAETSKLLSPGKTVLIPDLEAGCSLAASITGADVRLLRERYPGAQLLTTFNSSYFTVATEGGRKRMNSSENFNVLLVLLEG